jgi:SAM-dependent methyltransferase
VDDDEPRPWDDTNAMTSVLEARHSAQLPLWAVYFYDDEAQYTSKLRWYGMELAELDDAGSILDIGCGSGEILRWYEVPPTYLGVDVVAALVKTARAAHPARRFECLDVLSAPLSRFDTVIMVGLLGLSPHPLELIERACLLTRTHLLFDFLVHEPSHHNNDRLHLRYLCRDEVARTLARNGLNVVRTRRVGANLALVARRFGVESHPL